jgi:hypothetical protein
MSDERPEVRNTAVRTLFLVVSSQGSRLSEEAWEEVLWQLLFPLLRSVHHMAATSSREEVGGCLPSSPNGLRPRPQSQQGWNPGEKLLDDAGIPRVSADRARASCVIARVPKARSHRVNAFSPTYSPHWFSGRQAKHG